MNPLFLEALQQILEKEQYKVNEPMSSHITFRVGGNADCYIKPSLKQLPKVILLCQQFEIPWLIIGNGSNLLVGDKGIRGVVIELGKNASAVTIEGNTIIAEAEPCWQLFPSRRQEQDLQEWNLPPVFREP